MSDKNINVFSCPHPFSSKRYDGVVIAGNNLEVILKDVGLETLLSPSSNVRLFVEDKMIQREDWLNTIPVAGQSIAVRAIPTGGGGGGKDVLRAVAFIAVVALAYYTGGLAMAAYGPAVGGLVAGGVGIVGALAVNALIPPSYDKAKKITNEFTNTLSITGIRNRMLPFGPVQRLFGEHKIYPPLAAVPYTETYGKDSYLRMLFCVGKGEYSLADYKIGETALSSFSDYTISDGDKDTVGDIYPYDVYEDALSVELEYATGWYEQTTQVDTEEISVDITLPSGLFRVDEDNGKTKSLNVGYEVQYRTTSPPGSWAHFPGSPYNTQQTIQHRHSIGFRKTGLTADQYDVQIKKTVVDYDAENPEGDSTFAINTSYWTALRSIKYAAPVNLAGCHLIALRIKASGQLNGVIDQFNLVVTSKLSAWNGSAWGTPATTRNPAWAYAEVLRGDSNKRAIADSRINGNDLLSWATACTAGNLYFDAIIDSRTTVFELLGTIAAAGRAARSSVDNKYTVVRDITQTTHRQHFSPRNSSNFSGKKIFQDIPHGLKCRFINSESNYQNDEIIVYDDGYDSGNSTIFETIDFFGVTTTDHIWKLARYHIAVARLRPETYTINTDVENIVCTRGDLVRLTHDALLVGLGQARIKLIDGNDVTIDDILTMEGGKTYAAQIRKDDGTMLNTTITLDAGEQTVITLGSVAGITVGDMIFFGETGSVSSDCIITRIESGQDLSARLTLVDYAPDVLTADSGEIPEYDPNITHIPEINRVPPTPNIESINLQIWSGPTGEAKIKELVAVINFSMGIETDIAPEFYQTQYREIDTDGGTYYGEWAYAPNVPDEARMVRVPVIDGISYDFRIRAVSQYGATSAWDTESGYAVVYAPTIPNDIAGLQLIQGGSTWSGLDCEMKWTNPTDLWRVTKYSIMVYKTAGLVLLRNEYVDAFQFFYSYSIVKNIEDNSGTPIGSLTFRIWAFSQHNEPSDTYDEIVVTHTAPSSVTSLAGTAWAGGVEFNWDANTDDAFSHFEYRVKVGAALNGESWLRIQNPFYLRMLTSVEKDTYGADATIYIEVKAVDVFGTSGASSTDELACSSLNIKVTDIDDFAVTASKLFTKIPVLSGDTWTDDTPDTDSVTWNAHTIYFDGVEYSITGDDTSNKYIYWDKNDASTTYHGTDTHPGTSILDDEAFIIATNIDGKHDMAWNAIANEVIGSAFIQTAAINNAHVNDLSAVKINTGTLDADRIGANSITVGKMTQGFTEAYGNVICDPTFALTQSSSDFRYWGRVDSQTEWGAAYGESGPGIKIDADGTSNSAYNRDGSNDWRYVATRKGDKIFVEIRIYKEVAFDGNIDFGASEVDENLSPGTYGTVSILPTDDATWETISKQITLVDTDCHFVRLYMNVTGGSTGSIYIDSVHVHIEPVANFRHASDVTKIDGGNIYANTITLGKLPASFIESYSNIICDPTFGLTTAVDDTNFHSLWGNWVWGDYGENVNSYGLRCIEDGNPNNNLFLDGEGNHKYIPLSQSQNVILEVRAKRDADFDATFWMGLWEYDENKDYLNLEAFTVTLTTSWATTVNQLSPTSARCHFIRLGFGIHSGTSTYGGVNVDSVSATIESSANFRHTGDFTKIDGGDIHASSTIAIGPATTWQSDGIQLDYNSGNPRVYCGDGSNEYFQFDGTNVEMSVSKADALIIKSGGNIKLESGGDLILEPHDSSPAKIIFEDSGAGTYDIHLARDATFDQLCIFPSTTEQCYFTIGRDTSGAIKAFNQIYIRADDSIQVEAQVSDDSEISRIILTTGNAYGGDVYLFAHGSGNSIIDLRGDGKTDVTSIIRPSSHKGFDFGESGTAWAEAYADNWNNVADFFNLDTKDDIAVIQGIKGSDKIDAKTGLELIDDSTLAEWLLTKRNGKIERDPDGKPYLSLKIMISLCMGAIRQLDNKIESLKT